ncbi:hypothetical protein BAUCODRAFT_314748 [Baudoinia panamericana UAMH 10762]|uniref:Uncharacterized protein n=1 Tax=Baudoinia panamericana (strain UAMH 10762) TaxID=717646 RepID=M2MXV7_BAUPA|nr:uncharacterized protein BAUCODRAFT_314748 [Baudoinia panamericana UAMH 10762]EMC91095.1 hypothetical protein BAUCODRAFT_314748 [Baudoinia panamericana UAMH 10762]
MSGFVALFIKPRPQHLKVNADPRVRGSILRGSMYTVELMSEVNLSGVLIFGNELHAVLITKRHITKRHTFEQASPQS